MIKTIKDLEAKLLPCPLCGGRARIFRMEAGNAQFRTEIACDSCSLTLDWRKGFFFSSSGAIVSTDLDPIEAWNRRYKSDKSTTENL